MNEFLHEYQHIVTDPAHMLAEVTFMILIDVIFLGLVVPLFRRHVRKAVDKRVRAEHIALDAEHGISHTPAGDAYRTWHSDPSGDPARGLTVFKNS